METLKKSLTWFTMFILLTAIFSIEILNPSSIEIDCWFFTPTIQEKPLVKKAKRKPAKTKEIVSSFAEAISDAASERKKQGKPYILPSVTLAQLILETGGGTSELMRKANNLFGIKASESTIATYPAWDDCGKVKCKFIKFSSPAACISYYYENVISSKRYSAAVNASKEGNYKKAAIGLKKGGYASDPKYADRLINIIETKNLIAYDQTSLLE